MKESKVTHVQANGSFESKYGTLYKFDITMENGDEGQYSSKKEEQTYFKLGETVKYTFEGGQYPKIKPFSEKPGSSRKQQSNVSFGVSYCKDLIIAGKLNISEWKKASEDIINFMNQMENK